MMKKLEQLKKECEKCCACELYKTRNNIVFSDGNPKTAKIVLIGEAPGANEDLQGKPFVGDAGNKLNEYLTGACLSREKDLYIINVLKCRPPENRKPKALEGKACFHFLLEQIKIIKPKIILLCGGTALGRFVKKAKMREIHGQILEINVGGDIYKAMPILHPSGLCTFTDKKNVMIKDLEKIKKLLS